MISLLLSIVVVVIVLALLLWVLQQMPMDPALHRIARVGIIVMGALIVIFMLLGLLGIDTPFDRPLVRP